MTTAYWCVLVASLMPLLWTAVAKFSGPGFNNRAPREFQARLTGFRARAHWAHQNSFEAFPPFAAAVIIAHLAGVAQERIDLLALAFIALRLVYGVLYLADQALLRSIAWTAAVGCVIALFVSAA
jgi:uncharacterized MAPEG superfamily protein